jgi:glycosyltransferase involved in cell wall biosynthesis
LVEQRGVEDRVVFSGFLDRLDDFYRAMDVVVNPARAPEAFGRVAIEALAAGTPVVSARVGAVAEVLRDDENALLISANDAPDLASAIDSLLHDRARAARLVERGRETVKDRFTVGGSVTAFLAVVDDVLGARRGVS